MGDKRKMNCPKCGSKLKEVKVKVEGATKKVTSFQCPKCDYFSFEETSAKEVIEELKSPLTIKQKVIKLSQNRLGIYFNRDVVRSLNLKAGEDIYMAVPDKKHILLKISERTDNI